MSQVSHPYRITGNIIVLYILIFNFLDTTTTSASNTTNNNNRLGNRVNFLPLIEPNPTDSPQYVQVSQHVDAEKCKSLIIIIIIIIIIVLVIFMLRGRSNTAV